MTPLGVALVAVGFGLLPAFSAVRPDGINIYQRRSSEDLVSVEGRGALSNSCEGFPGKRIVMVTVSTEYYHLFKNWLGAAGPFLQDTEHLYVVAEDEKKWLAPALEHVLEVSGFNYTLARPPLQSSVVEGPYNSESYGSVVWRRPEHILSMLQKGCSVLYADVDTVWMRDPFSEIDAAGPADLYLTDDDPRIPGENLCTCFMYFHPTAAGQNLLQSWSSASAGNTNQAIFNEVLQEAAINRKVLPKESFPPGFWADKWSSEVPPAVYHANYHSGADHKMRFFQERSLWNPTAITE